MTSKPAATAIDVARLRHATPKKSTGFCEGLDASQCSGVVVAGISGANVEVKFSALQEKFSELQGDVTVKKMTVSEMSSVKCSQAEFGRLVGLTRSRINQFVKDGLIVGDGEGVDVITSLKRFYLFKAFKNFYPDMQPTDELFQRYLSRV